MWALKAFPFRKGTIQAVPTAASGYSQIGIGGSPFTLTLDTDYFSPNDVLELSDRRTLIQIMNDYPVQSSTTTGAWEYQAKLVSNVAGAYLTTALLQIGMEIGFAYTSFHEMSETGYEKNSFPEWQTNYMTIQRMQFSLSGTANNTVLWVEHNGQKLWLPMQEKDMLRRWAYAREMQLINGRATIDANENVYLKDLKGRDIIAGDGILAQGDASMKYQYNTLSVKGLETVMQDLQLMQTSEGSLEVFIGGGQKFVWDFARLFRDVFKYNPMPLFMSDDDKKRGVNATFNMYEMGGVKLNVAWIPAFDAQFRPKNPSSTTKDKNSGRAVFISLGNTIGGDPNIELVTLGNGTEDRTYVKKIIDGMTSVGGESKRIYASNSMDGVQVQVLSETGVCMKNPFGLAEMYMA